MPEPQMTTWGGWMYDAVRPIAEPYDEQRGYPLAIFMDAIGRMFQPVHDLVDDPTILVDPDRAPRGWLPWLSQFNGSGLPATGLASEADERALIKDPPRARRGTVPAMVEDVQAFLTGSQRVVVVERVGGNAWRGTLTVFTTELKPGVTVAQIQTAINTRQKPAGMIITVSAVAPTTYNALRDTHTDYNDIRSTFVSYDEARTNPTKQ